MTFDKRTIKIICFILGGAILLAFLLNNLTILGTVLAFLWGLIFPFILGYFMAFVINIPMRGIEHLLFKRRPASRAARPISFVLTLLLLFGLIALVVVLLVPQLWDTIVTLAEAMPGYITRIEDSLGPYLADLPIDQWMATLETDWQDLLQKFGGVLQSGITSLFSTVWDTASGIVGGFVSFFVGITFACYLLLDKEHLTAQFKGLLMAYLPKDKYDKTVEMGQLVSQTYTRFVGSQMFEAVLVTCIYLVLLLIFRFPYPLLIATTLGISAIIPMIGPIIGSVIGGLLILVAMGPAWAIGFIIMVVIVQQIEGNIIYPAVAGKGLGLPPIWILVAVMLGGSLAGIFGMLFFIPLFSVIYTLVRRNAKKHLDKKGLHSPVEDLPKRPKRHFFKKKKKAAENVPKNTGENTGDNTVINTAKEVPQENPKDSE